MRNLRRRMVWVKRAEVQDEGRAYLELTGVWSAAPVLKNEASPDGVPDRCLLLLDADTLWPCRVEWWGPTAEGKGLLCLMRMELRDPVFNHPMSPEECARNFTFDPGTAVVVDESQLGSEETAKKKMP